jgi:cell division protein FtsB
MIEPEIKQEFVKLTKTVEKMEIALNKLSEDMNALELQISDLNTKVDVATQGVSRLGTR